MTQWGTSLYNGGMSIVFAHITRSLERRTVKDTAAPYASAVHLQVAS